VSGPNGRLNAFSVDVEDFFQVAAFEGVIDRADWDGFDRRVESNTRRLLELLDRHGVRATMFVLGWVAERAPELVREISAGGHELAIHGYGHQRVTELTPDEFRQDVRSAKRLLEDIAGVEVRGYRAPTYSIVKETMWAVDILLDEGFLYDSSIFPIRHDRYGIPDAPRFPWVVRSANGSRLVEFPISTVRVLGMNLPFVGGGYLRLLPVGFAHWGMRRLNEVEGKPAIVYVHPWELDPGQPRQQVGWLARVRHYRNLEHTEERLAGLFESFRFGTVSEVLEELGELAGEPREVAEGAR
jgi:polysaccharide deacetylase family protein (PEP-CTERM system associated)